MIGLQALKEQLRLLGHELPDSQIMGILQEMNISVVEPDTADPITSHVSGQHFTGDEQQQAAVHDSQPQPQAPEPAMSARPSHRPSAPRWPMQPVIPEEDEEEATEQLTAGMSNLHVDPAGPTAHAQSVQSSAPSYGMQKFQLHESSPAAHQALHTMHDSSLNTTSVCAESKEPHEWYGRLSSQGRWEGDPALAQPAPASKTSCGPQYAQPCSLEENAAGLRPAGPQTARAPVTATSQPAAGTGWLSATAPGSGAGRGGWLPAAAQQGREGCLDDDEQEDDDQDGVGDILARYYGAGTARAKAAVAQANPSTKLSTLGSKEQQGAWRNATEDVRAFDQGSSQGRPSLLGTQPEGEGARGCKRSEGPESAAAARAAASRLWGPSQNSAGSASSQCEAEATGTGPTCSQPALNEQCHLARERPRRFSDGAAGLGQGLHSMAVGSGDGAAGRPGQSLLRRVTGDRDVPYQPLTRPAKYNWEDQLRGADQGPGSRPGPGSVAGRSVSLQSVRSSSVSGSLGPPGARVRKVDRVARYQQLQQGWTRDSFLASTHISNGGKASVAAAPKKNAVATSRKPLNFHAYFKAMHAAESAEQAMLLKLSRAKTSHDLAPGSQFVAPDAKRRDALRWETRQRLQTGRD